ncbi:MAG: MlaD family protein [Thermoanaerobaculia bacterium]|nr:MlaD family protein [Thermoanaerobaculia bacterium]
MPREAPVLRVGITVLAGLAVLAAAILLIGEKDLLFSSRTRYFVRFDGVANLVSGNPVQLNGVDVGFVDAVILPDDLTDPKLVVWIEIDSRYADRIRADSLARIQTLGLLGDKYVALSSGTPAAMVIEPGGEIPAAPATEIDELLASGGDVVQNLSVAASSLSNILRKMEQGEGLLGLLVAEQEGGPPLADTVSEILESVRVVVADVAAGEGTLGRLLYDDELATRLDATIGDLQGVLAEVEGGDGLLPRLLSDGDMADELEASLASFADTSERLDGLVTEMSEGDGLMARLVHDGELADEITGELRNLLERLNEATGKLTSGDGTAALLLNDPSVYEALNDILVGIDESPTLRWLVRNRQKAGIKSRYEAELEGQDAPP